MPEALVGLCSGLVGAIAGSSLTSLLAKRTARERTRTDTLLKTSQDINALHVAYSMRYSTPGRMYFGADVLKAFQEAPDPVNHAIRESLEKAKSAIHSDRVAIAAHFPKKVSDDILPLLEEIIRIIADSKNPPTLEILAEMMQKAEDKIVKHLQRYAKK